MNDENVAKIQNFLRSLREDSLFEADRNLKQLEQDLSKLEKRLKEVTGENNDFTDFLKKNDNDPSDKERVKLISELLKESSGSSGDLDKVKGIKDEIKALIDQLRAKLRA